MTFFRLTYGSINQRFLSVLNIHHDCQGVRERAHPVPYARLKVRKAETMASCRSPRINDGVVMHTTVIAQTNRLIICLVHSLNDIDRFYEEWPSQISISRLIPAYLNCIRRPRSVGCITLTEQSFRYDFRDNSHVAFAWHNDRNPPWCKHEKNRHSSPKKINAVRNGDETRPQALTM